MVILAKVFDIIVELAGKLAEKTAGRKLAQEMAKKAEARDTAEKRPSILSQLGEKKKEAMEHAPKAKAPGRAVPEAAL